MSHPPQSGNDPGDAELVAAAQTGDADAFGQLVTRHQDRAYNLAWRLIGNREDAAEAVQEAFMNAWRGMRRFRGGSGFYTWLYRIVVNVVRSRQRFEAVRPNEYSFDRPTAREPENDPQNPLQRFAADCPDPAESASRSERCRILQEAIANLDERHRTLIVLRDIQGHDYGEIAEILNCPRGTVKSRLHRARLALKESLAPVLAQDEEAAQ